MRIVVFGAADEFVFPARLAFHIKDAALVGFNVDQARDGVVRVICFAGKRIDRKLKRFGAGSPALKGSALGLNFAVGGESNFARGQNFVAVAHGQRGFASRIAALMKSDRRGQAANRPARAERRRHR